MEQCRDKIFALYPNLINLIFSINTNLSKEQAKCISYLIELINDKHDTSMKGPKQELGNRVFTLASLVEPAFVSNNDSIIKFLQSVFANLSFAYMKALIDTPDWKLLEIMQKLLTYQSEEGVDVCEFWGTYFKNIDKISDKEMRKGKILALQEVIKSLVVICLTKIELTEGSFLDLNAANEDDELLRREKDNRYYYKRLLHYIGECVDAKDYWLLFKDRFMACVQAINTNPAVNTPWIQLEAIFVTLSALLRGMHGDDLLVLKELFTLMLNMNKEIIQLQRAIIGVLSSISKGLYLIPDVLKLSLKYLIECFVIPLLREDAEDALISVMESNYLALIEEDLLSDLLPGIFSI